MATLVSNCVFNAALECSKPEVIPFWLSSGGKGRLLNSQPNLLPPFALWDGCHGGPSKVGSCGQDLCTGGLTLCMQIPHSLGA